jgi:hypothetical protein
MARLNVCMFGPWPPPCNDRLEKRCVLTELDNPEIGGNSSDCSVDGPMSNTYWTKFITGNGNNGAHKHYIIGQLNPPFSLRAFLYNTKPAGFDPNAPSTSLRGLQAGTNVKSFMKV